MSAARQLEFDWRPALDVVSAPCEPLSVTLLVSSKIDTSPRALTVAAATSDAIKESLHALARVAGERGDGMIRSFSGADQADSEVYYCERRVYVAVAGGAALEEALAAEDRRWRTYAAEQARKVAAAPKIRRGPCSGHSVISHRWVDPERFAGMASHIRFMVRKSIQGDVK